MKTNIPLVFLCFNVLIFLLLAFFGINSFHQYKEAHREEIEAAESEKQYKIQQTQQKAEEWAEELAKKVDKKHFIKHQGDGPPDAWNKAMQVAYSGGTFLPEKLKVSSAGPDGSFGTSDDIMVEKKK